MDGEFKSFKVGDEACVVQNLAKRFKEDAEIRLAKISNGADPEYRNGNPTRSQARWTTGAQWDSRKKTKKARLA